MRTSHGSRPRWQAGPIMALFFAVLLALSACSSSSASEADAPPSSSSEQTQQGSVETTGNEPAPTSAPAAPTTTEAPAPASEAAQPVTNYPSDPNIEPTVDLGPPPPAYQAPRDECPPQAKACVDLTNNMTWLQVNGEVIFGPVQHIAGRPGYRTTPGMHQVFWKNINHVSSIYGTPMPYAIFFTKSGMAFHEGELYIPSHGCVHLTHEAATAYWENLKSGDRVFIFGEAKY